MAGRLSSLRLAPDGRPRPDAPFGRGPFAARVLRRALLAASAVVSRVPARALSPITEAAGAVEWALRPAKRTRLAENLCHTLGLPPDHAEVQALVRREIVNEARRSADFLWAAARPDELLATTEIVGREHVAEALEQGRGVVLVSLHVGGWEVATALPRAVVPVPTTALVTDDWLAWAVEGLRVRAGLGILYDSEPATAALRLLRRGEALLLLGDYAKPWMRTYPVRLLDAVAELPAGITALSRLGGSPLVPFTVLPVAARRWRVEIEPPLAPPPRDGGEEGERELLQRLADRWTETLRTHAEHWAAVYPLTWRDP
ncbi:MAG TPA: lysophospholipid acyltransferase family protein [Gaiellaceae bacterium]|nr:lysophospholipid acyltransferase family protein [Gaiellaceae bacterium]